ncbi:MAG: hypothetical protein JRF33_17810 [Deltaproteobacteria bacterium]|nr:hypothetical protein [Deltaproteobacteria bacterium]
MGYDLVNDVLWRDDLGVYIVPAIYTPGCGSAKDCEFTSDWEEATGWVETVPVFYGGRVVMSDVINDGVFSIYITWTNLNKGPVMMEEVK